MPRDAAFPPGRRLDGFELTVSGWTARLARALASGLPQGPIVATDRAAANTAEIKVLAPVVLTTALGELTPQFEQVSGDTVMIGQSLKADLRKRILDGETSDIIDVSRPVMEACARRHHQLGGHGGAGWRTAAKYWLGRRLQAGAARGQVCLSPPLKRAEARGFQTSWSLSEAFAINMC